MAIQTEFLKSLSWWHVGYFMCPLLMRFRLKKKRYVIHNSFSQSMYFTWLSPLCSSTLCPQKPLKFSIEFVFTIYRFALALRLFDKSGITFIRAEAAAPISATASFSRVIKALTTLNIFSAPTR